MLLRNESRVKHSIDIKLVFDDNTTRELEIHEGECVEVSYKRNGCLKYGVGVIREIKPIIRAKYRCCDSTLLESAVITLDMSEDNNACIDKIELDDIIDIKIIYPCCCQIPNVEKPEKHHCSCSSENCKCNKLQEPSKNQCDCTPHHCNCEPNVHYSCVTGSVVTNRGVIAHE